MKRNVIRAALAVLILTGGVFAYRTVTAARADCPGKIVCPLTGQVICADKCPMAAEVPSCCKSKPSN